MARVIIVFTCISYVLFVLYYTHVLLIYVLTVIVFLCTTSVVGMEALIHINISSIIALDQILAILFAINVMHIWNIV